MHLGIKEAVAGKPRTEFEGALYHVIVRGNRRDIFRDESDRVAYLERIEHYREHYRCIVYAYVLMSNQVHLMIETGRGGAFKDHARYPVQLCDASMISRLRDRRSQSELQRWT